MFSDRRKNEDRRQQYLPMPPGLDRRRRSRRTQQFHAQPWWLRTNYAAELVSESTIIESGFVDPDRRHANSKKESSPKGTDQ